MAGGTDCEQITQKVMRSPVPTRHARLGQTLHRPVRGSTHAARCFSGLQIRVCWVCVRCTFVLKESIPDKRME
jgi:hypothetical protein